MIIAISITFFFLILRFTVTVFNFISDPKLRRIGTPYYDLVSILIPVRNEEENILSLLESIHQQDYPHYEVIILDDDSSDNTYSVCQSYTDTHPQVRIIKGAKLPPDWLGKNFACHQLAKEAKGQYLLFLDANGKIHKKLINSAIHRMHILKLSLLSLFTDQEMQTLEEKSVVPLMHYILLNLLPIRLIYLVKNYSVAAASGQFMLFDAATYRQYEWHKLVKNKVVEDVEIMKILKSARLNSESLLANGLISCRMYKDYKSAINGFSRKFLAAFNYSIPGFLIYLVLLIGGPMIVIMTMNLPLIAFMVGLIILTRIMVSFAARQNVWYNIILHPMQMINLVIIAFLSIQRHLTRTMVWKGRKVY